MSRPTLSTRQTLLLRVRDPHDETSWEEFCELYRGFILGLCRSMRVAHHDAEDVTQRVLLKIWKHLRKFEYDERKGSFRSWLGTVTCNLVRTYLKEPKRREHPVEDEALVDLVGDGDQLPAEMARMIDKEWKLFVSDRAWQNVKCDFSDSVREVFLAMMTGETAAVVAERFGLQENTVYVYRKRVVHRLQREIRRLEAELG